MILFIVHTTKILFELGENVLTPLKAFNAAASMRYEAQMYIVTDIELI